MLDKCTTKVRGRIGGLAGSNLWRDEDIDEHGLPAGV